MLEKMSFAAKTRQVALAVAVLVGAVVGGAVGASFGPNLTGAGSIGEIHGCVRGYTGGLRIVNSPAQCSASEYPISWDQEDEVAEADIVRVEDFKTIETDDERESVFVACPDDYTVVGGGAGRTFSSGNDHWYMDASSPRLPGDPGSLPDLAGWTASFETVSGQDAVGSYGFFVEAMCISIT